jgi:hypothetical protein
MGDKFVAITKIQENMKSAPIRTIDEGADVAEDSTSISRLLYEYPHDYNDY